MNLGINAFRARSGGAIVHLVGIFEEANPPYFEIREVHVGSHAKVLSAGLRRDLPLEDLTAFVKAIESIALSKQEGRISYGGGIRQSALTRLGSPEVVLSNRKLFALLTA